MGEQPVGHFAPERVWLLHWSLCSLGKDLQGEVWPLQGEVWPLQGEVWPSQGPEEGPMS